MSEIKIDEIIRSRRKTIALIVTHDARLVIRAPAKIPVKYLYEFALQKKLWIQQKQASARENFKEVLPKTFTGGETFWFLGQSYPLRIEDESHTSIEFTQEELIIPQHLLPQAKELLVEWYRKQASDTIRERVEWYAQQSGFYYTSVRISDAKKRWGSCGVNGGLNFSWRLVMAPLDMIDYVVIHELVHVEERNHSPRFWNKVEKALPDYKQRRKWLKEHDYLLVFT